MESPPRSSKVDVGPAVTGGDAGSTPARGDPLHSLQHFETGSVRDSRGGKGRFDLLSPYALRRLALVSEHGANKYGDRNWEKGQPLSRYMESTLRHLFDYMTGAMKEDSLAQAFWNIQCMLHEECKFYHGGGNLDLLDIGPFAVHHGMGKIPPAGGDESCSYHRRFAPLGDPE